MSRYYWNDEHTSVALRQSGGFRVLHCIGVSTLSFDCRIN